MTNGAARFQEATAALRVGDVARAEKLCEQAIELEPRLAGAQLCLGLLLKRRGALRDALARFERAAELEPRDRRARHEAGQAAAMCGALDRSVAHFQAALRLEPDSLEVRVDLATALRLSNRPAEAVPHYREAIQRKPDFALAHNNLGVSLLELRQFDEAIACLRRALELAPDLADAHLNMGNALKDTGLVADAAKAYRRALELNPAHCHAHGNLVFALSFHPECDDRGILEEARRFNDRHLSLPSSEVLPPVRASAPERRLRVGYVSSDFREHVLALFLLPLLANHDRNAVEVFCYSNVQVPDHLTPLHRERADHFREIAALDDAAAAHAIRDDRIDVLIDVTMHMAHNRLGVLARRPAPVQACWLAYPGTTGAPAVEYRLSDRHLDPPGTDDRYSEVTIRLDDTFWCFDPLVKGLNVSPLPAAASGVFTFGSLNNFCKTNQRTFELWATALRRTPRSRLVLLAPSGATRTRVLENFERAGVGREHVEFVNFQPRGEYLKTYHRIDLALDTVPYNGHTTSLDAWWMGVPVLTLAGDTVGGRAGLCHAMNLGLPEFCVASAEEFGERAATLAADPSRLATLRAGLRERIERSPLMDAPRFARSLERAYREMWRRACATGQ